MFAVISTSFTPSDGEVIEYRSVVFVTLNQKVAENFVKEKMAARTSAYNSEFEVEQVEVR